ncbi:MAG: hypothetical protein IPL79_07940 [Myxococcales bacterium]|nr:hypothetical protein [Myxococcales bacterium]
MPSLTATTPMLPKGTAAALNFSTASQPAATFAERIAHRYLGAGPSVAGVAEAPWRARLAPEIAWIFPRAWYLQPAAQRLAVPRWFRDATSDAPLEDHGIALRAAMEMPVVGAGGAATAAHQSSAPAGPAEHELARAWASTFERFEGIEGFEGPQGHMPSQASGRLSAASNNAAPALAARGEPWLPKAVSALAARSPMGLVHLAWSDAILTQMVGAPNASSPPLMRAPRGVDELSFVARPPRPLRRELASRPDLVNVAPPPRTPVFADDDEISDDVFAAIARPTSALPPQPATPFERGARADLVTRSASILGDDAKVARVDARADAGDVGHMTAPPAFGDLFAASMAALVHGASGAPMGVRIRLADAQAAHAAPHWFSSGEVDAAVRAPADSPRRGDALGVAGGPSRQVPLMPQLATIAGSARAAAGARQGALYDVEARAWAGPVAAENSNEATAGPSALPASAGDLGGGSYARHAPGARGYAAALQATELALGVAYLSMQFVTPGEAAVARAMQLAPALWTSGVTLAAAGGDAVAARWSALEQMALVSPARARAPERSLRLPRGVYAWPAAATAQWQQAAAADDAAGDEHQQQPELRRAFAAVWGEAAVRERMAAQTHASAAQAGLQPSDGAGVARWVPGEFSRTAAVAAATSRGAVHGATSGAAPGAMPLVQSFRNAAAPREGIAGAASTTAAERAPLQAWPANSELSQPTAYAGDAASRMLVALTAGVPRDALPASVLTWVAQLEVAVANEQRAASPAGQAPGMPALALAGHGRASEAHATSNLAHAREAQQLARAEQVAELADLRSTYVVAGPASGQAARGGAERLRAEISSLRPSEIAALLQAAGPTPSGSSGTSSANVFGGASVALPAQWSDGAAASLAAGMAPALAGDTTSTEPSLYEMTMIAALNQAAPTALAARAAHEPVPAHLDAAGPAHVALDVEAEAQAVLREVLHLIHALRDRNGDF